MERRCSTQLCIAHTRLIFSELSRISCVLTTFNKDDDDDDIMMMIIKLWSHGKIETVFIYYYGRCLHFYRAAWNADEVLRWDFCLSVCPSNACIVTKRKKNLSRFLYLVKDHSVLFYEQKNGWWGATTSIWNFGSTGPRWSEIADFEPIIARSASARPYDLAKKVQLILIGSLLRAFQRA